MKGADLGGPLLASVSRSFYLTIRVLPKVVQAPIGLAYLLARASDTIADDAPAPALVRQRHLAALAAMIREGGDAGLTDLQREIQPSAPGERELIARLPACLAGLQTQPAFERQEIAAVLQKIIHGQALDLERFGDGAALVALPSAAALDEYTYLVAGCVGEFWTRLCVRRLPHYAALESAELSRLGENFGKGLQLVNILRDAPADLRAGRCYLPEDEMRAVGAEPGAALSAPQRVRPVFDHWLAQAQRHLGDGFRYLEAVRPARLRMACFLPWYLGVETLRLLAVRYPLETGERVKVPRSTVRRALLLALPVAFSPRALGRFRSYALAKK